MSQKHQFVRDLLTGSPSLSVIAALLEAGNAKLDRKLATVMLIAENLEDGYGNANLTKHVLENYIKVLDVIESYKVELPEEISIIERVVASLEEDGEGGGATVGGTGVSGGSGAAAGQVNTAAIAAAGPVTTDAIDAKTPRIYPRKKKPSKAL